MTNEKKENLTSSFIMILFLSVFGFVIGQNAYSLYKYNKQEKQQKESKEKHIPTMTSFIKEYKNMRIK